MTDDPETSGNQHVWGSVLAGVVIGAVVGGSLALLFAPKSGRELRGDIEEAFEGVKERTERVLDDLQESAANLRARSQEMVDQTRDNLSRSVEVGKEAYQQKRQELTAQLEGEASGI
ncbi:MAG TPA: YtxH domain-containing protein [Armatimonadaceae bacterium]|jgi:gas vesicle protein|nr:YtxH domain-containing protein [Armatimonadaceae bacterium]